MNAVVRCKVEAAELTASGSVVAPLWLEIGDVAFPEVGWHDFPVPVLGWWIEALRNLVTSADGEALLRFMDGPFEVRLAGGGSQAAVMLSSRGGSVDAVGTTDAEALLKSAKFAAKELVSRIEGQGHSSPSLTDLKRITCDSWEDPADA